MRCRWSGTETVSTFDADGRVLAHDLVSALQVPPQDNSSMDGYAVRSSEIADEGVPLPVSQRIPAGAPAQPLTPGTVARIFTGAPIPPGADAVVMQEDTEPAGEQAVRIMRVPSPGQWIRRSGEDVARGAVVLAKGARLSAAALGLAASIGMDRLTVVRRPRVALFSTGDELVMPGDVPPEQMKPGSIYNSNRFFLSALLRRLGCEVTDLGIVPDRRDATVAALGKASQEHDLDPHQRRRLRRRGGPHQAGRRATGLAGPVADRDQARQALRLRQGRRARTSWAFPAILSPASSRSCCWCGPSC